MRKKRKSIRLKPKPILWALLICVVAAGIAFSPITAVRHVRVEGATPEDRARLEDLLLGLRGVPCVRVDPRVIESRALMLPEMKKADLSRNPFGSALLRVQYRTPVARMMGTPDLFLDAAGVLYPALHPATDLPMVQMPKNGPPTLATFVSNWEPQRIAQLALAARTLQVPGVIRIQMDDRGVVSLNLGTERVIFGSLDDLDKKVSILRQRLAAYPDELKQNDALDLTNPDYPAVIPPGGVHH
jgi:cell division septal protein FtsQ